jgi:2-dehydropantoate 2-reductase
MKVAVMAAGGIGGYYGGLLAKGGHEVTFIARGAHLQAMRENGLYVKCIDDEFLVKPARVTDDPTGIGKVGLVLFSVKTYDTDEAARAIGPIVGKDTAIVTFQNGIESAERLRAVLGRGRVASAPTQIETFVAEPGRIEQKSNFRVVMFAEADITSSPAVETLARVFRQNNLQVNVVPDIRKAVWLKFLRLAPVAGLATLARSTPCELFQLEEARGTLNAAMREVMAVGAREGILLDGQDLASATEWALNLKEGIKPSMQKDVERGNRLEIDALSGAVVRLGKKHNVATPVHQAIFVGLKPEDERNRRARQNGKG